MGEIQRKYFFKGLDTRTNKLYREEGTASDCRNVRLDSTRKLVKVNDMDTKVIPRGTDGETGEFLDKLPFLAQILDILPYEDHFVICTLIREEDLGVYKDVNKFYKWIEGSNTVEFIPFEKETYSSAKHGQEVWKRNSDIAGGFTYSNQENVLFFAGSEYPAATSVAGGFPIDTIAKDNNLSIIFTYDGKVIGRAGCPSGVNDSQTEDEGVLAVNEYMRLLPFKIDYLGRHTFGNYSTHKGTNVNPSGLYRAIQTVVTPTDTSFDHIAFVKINDGGTYLNLSAAGSVAARTIDVIFYKRGGLYNSAAKGQYLYGIDANVSIVGGARQEDYVFYRCIIEDADYVGNTVTLGEFQSYSDNTGLWETATVFRHSGASTEVGSRPYYLSNIINAVYGSDNYTFGYTLKGFVNIPYGIDATHTINYLTSKSYTGDPPNPVTDGVSFEAGAIFLYFQKDLNDIIDITTTKLPPPKVRHLTNYLSAMVCVDHEALYFSDFSIGGTIEVFTPFDTFSFGSSKRGSVTGVFANETYLVGFREQEAYYITGNIFTANYRIQAFKSTRIGCSDPRSITDYRGAGIFASEKGLFVASQGGSMQELSDKIENIFTDDILGLDLDLFDVKTIVDFKREYLYFAITSNDEAQDSYIIAYSYYHDAWFIYDNISALGGFDMFNNKLYASDGINIFVELPTQLDAVAFYRSNFEALGLPSLEKKFLQVLLFTVDSTQAHNIGIKTYKDWNTAVEITNEVKAVAAGQVDMTQRFNPSRSKSAAIEINSATSEQLIVNGYEYEIEADVSMFKNDD